MWGAWLAAGGFWAGVMLVWGRAPGWPAGAGLLVLGGALALLLRRRAGEPAPQAARGHADAEPEPSPRRRLLLAAGLAGRPVPRARSLRGRVGASAVLAVAFLLLGVGWGTVRSSPAEIFRPPPAPFAGTAASDPRTFEHGWGLEARLYSERTPAGATPVTFRVWLRGRGRPPPVGAGERIRVRGSASPLPADESGFSEHLRLRGVVANVNVTALDVLGPAPNPAMRLANSARRALTRGARRVLPGRESGLLLGLTIGDTSGMDPEVEEDFRATGLGHLVAVSGSNVAMVLAPILGLAGMARARPATRLAMGTLAVAFFALVTRWEPSVLRASVMASLTMLGVAAGRPRDTGRLLGAAVLALLIVDPRLGFSLAFQLSVAATAGIVALSSRVASRLGWLPGPVAMAVATTVGAQAAVTPLLLSTFGVVPGVALIANVLAAPAVTPAFLGGVVASLTGLVVAPLGDLLAALARLPIAYLAEVADRTARLAVPSPVGFDWVIPVAAIGVGAAALFLLVPPGRPRRRVGTLMLIPVLIWTIGLRGAPPGELTVIFFDVGQGDAALVRTPEGVNVLLDGGPDDQVVATKLAALGVGRIDLVVASHAHADHVEGIPAVFARHRVGLLLEPGCPAESPSYRRLLAAAEAEGVPGRNPRGGERWRVGRLVVEVLGPDACAVDSPNDDSLVLRLSYEGAAVLFPGDAEIPAQRDLLDDADPVVAPVLKVPHHGSATSDPAFFEAVGARVAVVSVGENDFGHPVPEILAALRATGARVLRTDFEGDVTVRLGPGGPRVESASR